MIKPGKSVTQVFKLLNDGEPVVVTPKLLEYKTDGLNPSQNSLVENWISFPSGNLSFDQPFLLHTGEIREFVLRIAPPKDISEDNYYRVLLFSTNPNPGTQYNSSSIQTSIGSILLLNITSSGMTAKDAIINLFDVPGILDSFDPLDITVQVKNTGKTYFRPVGEIKLTGPLAHGSYQIEPQVIINGQTRKLLTHLSPTEENRLQKSTLHLPGIYLGKYEVEVNFTLDESNIRFSQKKSLYGLPIKASIGLVLLIIFVVIIKKRRLQKNHVT